jgi:hypothetical protein
VYQPGEEGNQIASALRGSVRVDPELKQPTSTQATAFLEREISGGLGARAGFVYFNVRNQATTFQPFRPARTYTVPFTLPIQGPTGRSGRATTASSPLTEFPTARSRIMRIRRLW